MQAILVPRSGSVEDDTAHYVTMLLLYFTAVLWLVLITPESARASLLLFCGVLGIFLSVVTPLKFKEFGFFLIPAAVLNYAMLNDVKPEGSTLVVVVLGAAFLLLALMVDIRRPTRPSSSRLGAWLYELQALIAISMAYATLAVVGAQLVTAAGFSHGWLYGLMPATLAYIVRGLDWGANISRDITPLICGLVALSVPLMHWQPVKFSLMLVVALIFLAIAAAYETRNRG